MIKESLRLPFRVTPEVVMGAIAGAGAGWSVGGSAARRAGYAAGEHGVSKLRAEEAAKRPGQIAGGVVGALLGIAAGKAVPKVSRSLLRHFEHVDPAAVELAGGVLATVAAAGVGGAGGGLTGRQVGGLVGRHEHKQILRQRGVLKEAARAALFDELAAISRGGRHGA